MIIALSGYGGCGKDTVADILVDKFGFRKYAWADTLRFAASELNPIVAVSPDGEIIRYNDAIEMVGYNEAKFMFPEVREILQRLGTEVGRNLIGDDVWVNATFMRIDRECFPSDNVVIADTRFANEAVALKDGSFHIGLGENAIVRVNRPGVGPAGDHVSEIALDEYPFDYTIDNNGTVEDLVPRVLHMYETLEKENSGLRLF